MASVSFDALHSILQTLKVRLVQKPGPGLHFEVVELDPTKPETKEGE